MPRFSDLLKTRAFWPPFLFATVAALLLQTFPLGLWAVPLLNYRVHYMGQIDPSDLAFVAAFALLFAFATALFWIEKKHDRGACACGSVGGVTALTTMLCPVCPVFLLSLFGISVTLMAVAPYFWLLRMLALGLVLLSITLLWRRYDPGALPRAKVSGESAVQMALMGLIVALLIGNQAIAQQVASHLLGPRPGGKITLSGNFSNDVAALVTPVSTPFYGQELGLDFSSIDNVNASLRILSSMVPKQGNNPIPLTEAEMARYIAIGTEPTITCEFCCSVKTLVRADGSATCGCAHARAMMGTAAYLIRNHPDLTNDEISYEIARQKGLYFPTQMQKRMAEQLAGDASKFSPDIRYLTMKLKPSELANMQAQAKESGFTPPAQNQGMVGGC
jgi:hypothetical protein